MPPHLLILHNYWHTLPGSSSMLFLTTFSDNSIRFFLSNIFLHFSPTHSRSLLMQPPIAISVFLPASISSLISGYLVSLPVFVSHFYMANSYTPDQFLLRTFLYSNIHSHFITFFLSALLTLTIILTRLFFKSEPLPVVSLLVPSSLMHSCMPG